MKRRKKEGNRCLGKSASIYDLAALTIFFFFIFRSPSLVISDRPEIKRKRALASECVLRSFPQYCFLFLFLMMLTLSAPCPYLSPLFFFFSFLFPFCFPVVVVVVFCISFPSSQHKHLITFIFFFFFYMMHMRVFSPIVFAFDTNSKSMQRLFTLRPAQSYIYIYIFFFFLTRDFLSVLRCIGVLLPEQALFPC